MELNSNFIVELFKVCLKNKRVLEVARQHLKYSYLISEEYKEVWSTIVKYYDTTEKLISIGVLSQEFNNKVKILKIISDIKSANTVDVEIILSQLEEFVKSNIFQEAYEQLPDLYNDVGKAEAYRLMKEASEKISDFKLKENYFTTLYKSYADRYNQRLVEKLTDNTNSVKIPTGIDELDKITRGGVDKGDIFLLSAQSGVGKSKFLRHIGVHASRRGYRILHVSAEGTLKENLDMYDAAVAGQTLWDIENANLPPETLSKVKKAANDINNRGGEVFIEAFEQFGTANMSDVRNLALEIIKIHGSLDGICLDYLELFDPGDGKKYSTGGDGERKRREATANKFKNICVELNLAGFTGTQSSTVASDLLNDPKFVQTRYHISEFKGVIKPFSYFITANQTKDEYKNNFMRLYIDKCRKYPGGDVIGIYQRYDRERFYDRKRTINEL